MKRILCVLLLAALIPAGALAAKARGIASQADTQRHCAHLSGHVGAESCRCTGNYVKVRTKPNGDVVLGHLEQADTFRLLDADDGWAYIQVVSAAKTSPDSYSGLCGWVDSDYVDCTCSASQYAGSAASGSQSASLPSGAAGKYIHTSGVGAWNTTLSLNKDGSFYAQFHDSDMGDTGWRYPNGTQYENQCVGRFGDVQKMSKQMYSMSVVSLETMQKSGTQHISDGVLHVITPVTGVELGDYFLLFLPGTDIDIMTEDHLAWIHNLSGNKLKNYYLYNVTQNRGFDVY